MNSACRIKRPWSPAASRASAELWRGHWGDPADLQGIVVFLASAASDYMHGTIVNIDGGWLSR
ncbi:MAG: SDR family oxidoreductase [Chloroflexi bacterium]|nr:SDR family oxidoreductase [Chloroflexota bacterium]